MLDEFEDIKFDLGIVNKSFVTLAKPLRIEDSNVCIRDTILLSPAGSGSLDLLGKLYDTIKLVIFRSRGHLASIVMVMIVVRGKVAHRATEAQRALASAQKLRSGH
jgi:hypothetical protein